MDNKRKVTNITQTYQKNNIHLNKENNDGDIKMFIIPRSMPTPTHKHTFIKTNMMKET